LRYIDSASRRIGDTIYDWLRALLPSAKSFASQSGFYRFDALEPFTDEVRGILDSGGRVDLVIGANEERLSAPDLDNTLALLEPNMPTNASFTLVGARNALFHPKTYFVELDTGARHAAVGSANFTTPGIGSHIEACLLLDENDDVAVLDSVRDAILAWPKAAGKSGHARQITTDYIRELEAERIIDPAPVPVARSQSRRRTSTGQSSFPSISRVPGVPRRRGAARPQSTPAAGKIQGASAAFPPNSVGIVKRLSRTDVKGFVGSPGTPYIALPPGLTDLANKLPMRPYGIRGEPRLDVVIEARLSSFLSDVVTSGTDPANITHVGMGKTRGSNVDLRFNILHGIVAGLIYVATQRAVSVPKAGDAVALELLNGGREVRMTFATDEPLRSALLSHRLGGRSWGWLPRGIVPKW
jgi:hypothetical protein